MSFGDPIFDKIVLSKHEQNNVRGKPLRYMLMTIERFNQFGSTIVEVGSVWERMPHDIGVFEAECCNGGHSTYFWSLYTDAEVYTVDISLACIQIVKMDDRLARVHAFLEDGISFLNRFDKKIDLLFLDAWDVLPGIPYAEKHLEAYQAAKYKLSEKCLILIDDTDFFDGGKGGHVVPVLLEDGFEIVFDGRQTLLSRGD